MPTLNHEAEIEFDVKCETCGATLTADVTAGSYRTNAMVKIEPCEACLEKAKTEGDEAGDEEGYSRGKADGHAEGYDKGFEAGKAAAMRVIEEAG